MHEHLHLALLMCRHTIYIYIYLSFFIYSACAWLGPQETFEKLSSNCGKCNKLLTEVAACLKFYHCSHLEKYRCLDLTGVQARYRLLKNMCVGVQTSNQCLPRCCQVALITVGLPTFPGLGRLICCHCLV